MSNTLNKRLSGLVNTAVTSNQKTRDSRNSIAKGFDIGVGKSYVNEDKKVAQTALREFENTVWKPKMASYIDSKMGELPHLKKGTPKYKQAYDYIYNSNYKKLQAAKTTAYQQAGVLRKKGQTQRQLENEHFMADSTRNETTGVSGASLALRDHSEAWKGGVITGAARTARYVAQTVADVGENEDGGLADKSAKSLKEYEEAVGRAYPAYPDIQKNGTFSQKVAVSAIEQVPQLGAIIGTGAAVGVGALALGAPRAVAALSAYGATSAAIWPLSYGDGNDSVRQELESATSEQLSGAQRSQGIYKAKFDKNIKDGLSEDEAFAKAHDQTISQLAEDGGTTVALASVAISLIGPGAGTLVVGNLFKSPLTKAGTKAVNKLAGAANKSKAAKGAIVAGGAVTVGGLNAVEEAGQELVTDYVGQKTAVEVGNRKKIDAKQNMDAAIMGGTLGFLIGGGTNIAMGGGARLQNAQQQLTQSQDQYADVATQAGQLREQVDSFEQGTPEHQAATEQFQQTKNTMDSMAAEAEQVGIPLSSLARRAPRITPLDIDNAAGPTDTAPVDADGSPIDTDTDLDTDVTPSDGQADLVVSEQEQDAQDANISELIAEQAEIDAAIEDGTGERPVEQSAAEAQAWYDQQRGVGKEGLSGVVARAKSSEQDTAFEKQQAESAATTSDSINNYIADQRSQQRQIDEALEQDMADAKTYRAKKDVEERAQQRAIDREQEEATLADRINMAEPYEGESFDTTLTGADGAPFNLARLWDENMSAGQRVGAIDSMSGGQVEQNLSKSNWQTLPQGVQRQLHSWMGEQLGKVQTSREQSNTGPAISNKQPQSKPDSVDLTTQTTTAPQKQTAAPTNSKPVIDDAIVVPDAPASNKSRVDTGPVEPIAEPTPTDNSTETVYKSKPAAKAAIKKQKLDPDNVGIVKMADGFKIVDADELRADTTKEDSIAPPKAAQQYDDAFAKNKKIATKKDGSPKYFLSDGKSQRFITDNEIEATHEVVPRTEGKQKRFEIAPKTKAQPVEVKAETKPKTEPEANTEDTKAVARKEQFADNKIFTTDKVESARKRMKSKLGQVNSGFDPELAVDGMVMAGAYIESGVRKFGDFAKLMIEDVGSNVNPYLLSFWEGARNYPELDTEGMTSVEDSKKQFDKLNATIDNTDSEQGADNDTGTSSQDNQPSADAGLSTADQANGEGRNASRVQAEPTSNVDAVDGRSAGRDTNNDNEDTGAAGASQSTETTDSSSQSRSPKSDDGAAKAVDKTAGVKATNYEIVPSTEATPSWAKIAERNVFIVELVKKIEAESRPATATEQAFIADYKGWGASDIKVFPHPDTGYASPKWQELGEKLEGLLTADEYATARRTTQYAHYTPPSIVNGMYKALEQFGFKGGQILEPASGIGIFNGLMPRAMASKSNYVGLELDPMTARIAQLLYPQSDMKMGDYIKSKLPNDHFDAAIGNPPFANIAVTNDPTYKANKLLLHDYFFAKTLDKLKPGGVMAFVTSKGTMDKKNSKTRDYFADKADLIGAIRLPNNAFRDAGTEVVTDIIFLRKRLEGESVSDTAWSKTKEIDIGGKKSAINEYFVTNPNMVLGKQAIVSGQFGDAYTVKSDSSNLNSQIETAIAQLPKDVYNPARGSKAEAAKVVDVDYGVDSSKNKEGGVYVKDGTLMRVTDGVGKPLTERYGAKGQVIALKPDQIKFLSGYTAIRDALKQSQQDQINDSPNWEQSLATLNKVYDGFVKKHGRIMAHTISERSNKDGSITVVPLYKNKQALFLDTESPLVSGLENIIDDGKGTIVKGPYLQGRSLNKPKTPDIKTTQDALIYVLDGMGTPNIERISELVNKTESEVIEELGSQIYKDPATDQWGLAETYLSGNVVEKLAAATASAKTNRAYNRNVAALQEVQPSPIAPNDISSSLGAAWIPGKTINEFSKEVLNADINADYSKAVGLWDIGGTSRSSDYSTSKKTTVELVEAIANSKKIVITYKVDDKTVVDTLASEEANQMAKKIKKAFKDWLWTDDARAQELADYYNKTYNNIVPPTFNGDHLTLAGISNQIKLRPHQLQGIYRIISQGDVYLNHAVGAGKTFTMIAGAMEEKRLGLINKPMFVVPNHMLDQFSQEFMMLYPAANIMVADDQNFDAHNRKQFVSEAALNTPDAIIITHSGFKKIGVKPETQEAFLNKEIDKWKDMLEATKVDGKDNRTSVKQMERNVEAMEKKLEGLLDRKSKDNVVFFEDMGVDKVIVDELHEFRKLSYATKMGSIKGIDPNGSQMATDLNMKLQLLREKNPGRVLVGASGTPVTNTMGEMFSIQRYFQPNQLEKDGLNHFDAWANQFGEVVDGLEQNAGGTYEVVPRFARFVNVPELMSRVRSFMDVLSSQDLGDVVKRPDVISGGREIVAIPTPDGFSDYQQSLAERITAIRQRGGKPEKGDDIILSVIGDGRFSAIDMRFVDSTLPSDPNSKLNQIIQGMAEAYAETNSNEYMTDGKPDNIKGGSLMMFTDIGLGEQSATSSGFDMKAWINSELIRQGVKASDIAFMRDNKAHAKKGKLFEDMRQGRKRIMIGGKDMETGVNAQKRLTHLFHLDAPWFPASVEQREGRIIRQGNQNKEVTVKAFATKGSYDSTMWGMVARKASFIGMVMDGDSSIRSMDDISEASAFEQASALSSGDPRALQLAGLRQDVDKLSRLYSAHQNTKFANQGKAKKAKQQLDSATKELAEIDRLLPNHTTVETGGTIGKVGNKTFDNRQEFGQAIIKSFKKQADSYTTGEQVLGTVAGYDVAYNGVMMSGDNFYADANINIPKADDKALFDTDNINDTRPDGLTTRIVNRVDGLAKHQGTMQQTVQQTKTDIVNYERRAAKSFDETVEFEQKKKDLQELEETLAAEAEQLNKDNSLTEADAVPESDQPKYSRIKQTDAIRKQYENTDQWMKAPDGTDTKLNENQWLQVRTPAFKEWFGDWESEAANASEVVDSNGEPMVVYHSTDTPFDTFDRKKLGSTAYYNASKTPYAATAGVGFWFSNEDLSKRKRGGMGSESKASFLNIRMSYELESLEALANDIETDVIPGNKLWVADFESPSEIGALADEYKNLLTDGGIDGMIIENDEEFDGSTSFVVFEPNQIKSATDNVGTFDSNNPDIRYSKTNKAKGSTITTPKQVVATLQQRLGKETVAKLVKSGVLKIRELNDFVAADGRLLVSSDVEGIYFDGKVTLIADNLDADTIVATLLHELGAHAGIQAMMAPEAYGKLMTGFDKLVESGNVHAVRAKERAEASTTTENEARDEYIPYLITEYTQATEGNRNTNGALAVIKRYINRVIVAIRTWANQTLGTNLNITPNDIAQLAEKMVKEIASNNPSQLAIDGIENMEQPAFSQTKGDTDQTDTAAFKKWFGDSKVVDANGDPLVVYHGTHKQFSEFNTDDFGALLGKGSYFTADTKEAQQYSGPGKRIVPGYISMKNPYYVNSPMDVVPNRKEMSKKGHDGVIYKNEDGSVRWAVAHKPTQIKSATENDGIFDSTNPDIRFSRKYSNIGPDSNVGPVKRKAENTVRVAQAAAQSAKFGTSLLLRRHLATPQHVGLLNPIFKNFTDNIQARIAYENNEAGRIQVYVPEIWDTRLIIFGKKTDMKKVSTAIFDGTMSDKVWSDSELETQFKLNEKQIATYRRMRSAINESVRNMTLDVIAAIAKSTKLVNIHTINRLKFKNLHPVDHADALKSHLTDELEVLSKAGTLTKATEARMQKQLANLFGVMDALASKYDDLVYNGYAPLMRFGNYAVEVRNRETDELDLFELYESDLAQRAAIKVLKVKYDQSKYQVSKGTLNPEGFKQFTGKGLSPETVQLFAAELGLDADNAHQAYLKIAISDRSALKRLIHRKKVPGYSEDLPRVLSSFVMSNARFSGRSLYNGEIENSIQNIKDGHLQNEAQNVFENMENAKEEFAGTRSSMFHWFMAFSPAFLALNLTQPFTQTIPKLTAYVGATAAHANMVQALGIVGKYAGKATWNFTKKGIGQNDANWTGFEDHLPQWVPKDDYLRMSREGHLDPQNVWMIKGLERGKAGVASGVWGYIETMGGWPAEVSESINRRGTMIAAYKTAKKIGPVKLKEKGFNSKYDFVVSIIQQTQGIYNKGNRSGLARGTGKLGQFGPLVMVFKQFTINYTEQMIRHGRDKEVKALATALIWQFMIAGGLGLAFTDDLRDIIEGMLFSIFGVSTNFVDFLQKELGEENANMLMYGWASEKTPVDFHGRSSMGNMLPGTDFIRPQPGDWGEVLGASSGYFENFLTAGKLASEGEYKDAVIMAAPRYVRDAASGIEIYNTGSYRNDRGDKVMDMSQSDAMIKGLGQFNPSSNARAGRGRSNAYDMSNMVKTKQNQFSKQLAEASYQENYERVDEIYATMDAWNDRNADHFRVDIDKVEESAERRLDKKDFTSDERQNIPEQLDDYLE